MYLLDTAIIGALKQARSGEGDPGLALWAGGVPRQELFLSVVTLLELQEAAAGLPGRKRGGADGMTLEAWIGDRVVPAFEGRILPVDLPVARRAGALAYVEMRDALLVATALVHGLTLVTADPGAYKIGRPKLFCPLDYTPQEPEEDWREAARGGSQWFRNLFVRM
jgi:predicted nucleic acid-binding protein